MVAFLAIIEVSLTRIVFAKYWNER